MWSDAKSLKTKGRCLLWLAVLACAPAFAAREPVTVTVTAPYLELRTGPGKSYPVFHAVERGVELTVVKKRTDWFKVVAPRDVTGWVHDDELARTRAGAQKIAYGAAEVDDYRRRRTEFGFALGRFDNDPVLATRGAFWMTPNVNVELSASHVAGQFSKSRLYAATLSIQPFSNARIAPYFGVGGGHFNNTPKETLVLQGVEETNATAAHFAVGVRGYLTRRFLVRADYRQHIALSSDDDNESLDEWYVGVSFFR